MSIDMCIHSLTRQKRNNQNISPQKQNIFRPRHPIAKIPSQHILEPLIRHLLINLHRLYFLPQFPPLDLFRRGFLLLLLLPCQQRLDLMNPLGNGSLLPLLLLHPFAFPSSLFGTDGLDDFSPFGFVREYEIGSGVFEVISDELIGGDGSEFAREGEACWMVVAMSL